MESTKFEEISWLEGHDLTKINYSLLKIQLSLSEETLSKANALIYRVKNLSLYNNNFDIYELAGMYLESVSQGHIFLDGNKRTSVLAMVSFLKINGYEINKDKRKDIEADLAQLALDSATHQIDYSNVAMFVHKQAYFQPTNIVKTIKHHR